MNGMAAAWTKLSTALPTGMEASGTLLYGNFAGSGLYKWDGSGAWTKLNSTIPASMAASGVVLYADYGASGSLQMGK